MQQFSTFLFFSFAYIFMCVYNIHAYVCKWSSFFPVHTEI